MALALAIASPEAMKSGVILWSADQGTGIPAAGRAVSGHSLAKTWRNAAKKLDFNAKAEFIVNALGTRYINIVLRIKPTARPSISNGSPGSITIV
jgi:hypothetical protein